MRGFVVHVFVSFVMCDGFLSMRVCVFLSACSVLLSRVKKNDDMDLYGKPIE